MMLAAAVGTCQSVTTAPPAVPISSSGTSAGLKTEIQKLISKADLNCLACVYVRDTSGTQPLVDLDGETPVAPASNNKLVTTAAGLTLLGADYESTTSIYRSGPIENGVLKGDLVIEGTGDPAISGRFTKDKHDSTIWLRQWAKELHDGGVKEIDGNIVADDSFFDDQYFSPDWYPQERGEWYEAEVSALSLNDACVDLALSGEGKLPGDSAAIELTPQTKYVTIDNQIKIAAKGRATERYYRRDANSNEILATGTLTVGSSHRDYATVHDPALFLVTVFSEALTSEGIVVKGKPVKGRGAAKNLSHDQLLIQHKSQPLSEIVKVINLVSHNLYAETVGKTLGRVVKGEGSFAAGARTVEEFCRTHNIYHKGHHVVDGCGLSNKDRVTCHQLVDVLHFMDNHKNRNVWRESLPQGGVCGSLVVRFQETSETRALASRILGKTGLIGGVRSMTGIITNSSGHEVYYSIILNHLENGDAGIKLIDQIAYAIARSN